MRSRLEEKMQGEAAMFSDEHIEALCQKGLNSEALDTVTAKHLYAEPDRLPDRLVVAILQACNPEALHALGKTSASSVKNFGAGGLGPDLRSGLQHV